MLGKRARPPMKRTTSMTEFTFDFNPQAVYQPSDPHNPFNGGSGSSSSAAASPKLNRRNSGDFVVETANFLRVCFLCKRRLIPGRDIYMYRGDSAFCSLECRHQQMSQDERKENKCSNKVAAAATAATAAAAETVAAV